MAKLAINGGPMANPQGHIHYPRLTQADRDAVNRVLDREQFWGLNGPEITGLEKEWAEFVLQNRKNRTRCQLHTFDIVIGPIANDTVGFQIRKFTSGIINFEQFVEELRYMKGITFQYFFATEKAIRHLKPL